MAILLENATLVTLDPQRPVLEGQHLLVDRGVIAGVGKQIKPAGSAAETRLDCSGKIVMPGLVNAHSHLVEILQRSFRDNVRMEVWREYRMLTEEKAHLTTEEINAAAKLACGEMLKNGVTAVVDHFSPRSAVQSAQMEAILEAFENTGIRGALAPALRDQDFVRLIGSPLKGKNLRQRRSHQPWQEGVRRLLEHEKRPGKTWTLMLGPSNPLNCSDSMLKEVVRMAEEQDLGIHTHLLETRLQGWGASRIYRKGVVRRMDRLGLLSPRLSAAHCIWLDEKETDLLAARAASVVHNPASNLKLGSGIAAVARMKKKGVNVALGTDGGDTSDTYCIFEQMKLAALLSRITEKDPRDWVTARDALEMGTINGARAVPAWRGKTGAIKVGYRADLLILKPRLSLEPLNDVIHQLVFCQAGRCVETVLVDGEIVVAEGRLTRVDEETLIQRVGETSKKMFRLYRSIKKRSGKGTSAIEALYDRVRWKTLRARHTCESDG